MLMREAGKAPNRILITCISAYSYQTEYPCKKNSNSKRKQVYLCHLTLTKFSYSIRSYCEGSKDPQLFGHTVNIPVILSLLKV